MGLLETLIICSEKAANIARLLRKNEKLFKKLVEQKSAEEANPRFQQDFKTLADVLIQEMVKHDVNLKFPSIGNRIRGEENNRFFSSELNKEIIVEIKETEEQTSNLLSELLDDDKEIASIMAAEVHRTVSLEEVNTKMPEGEILLDIEQLSIWIDPIDGTNEYVQGGYEEISGNFYLKGLKCVSVLIGAYNDKGEPVMGVINQPFFEKGIDKGYQCNWGINMKQNNSQTKLSSIEASDWRETNCICIGDKETDAVIQALKQGGYDLIISRGAGYKLLTVILGIADAYVLSKPTTYFWDTCGPQAILKAIGGDIIEMDGINFKQNNLISYRARPDNSKCHKAGIIAYRNETILQRLLKLNWTS